MNSDVSSLTLSAQHLIQIKNLVQEDLASSAKLIVLLGNERDTLIKRKTTELNDIVEAKNNLLDAIEDNCQHRFSLLTLLKLAPNEDNWQQLIQQINDDELNKSAELLIANLQQCQHLNNVNGKMVARGKQTLGRLLNTLRGQMDPPSLYNNAGSTDSHNASHTVVKA